MELHGGNIYRYPECYDFSANLNPLGMSAHIRWAVTENTDLWEHYPEPDCIVLRSKLSETEHIPMQQIVCGNGADDLIWRIVQTLRPKTALLVQPTFTEYRRALDAVGCVTDAVQLTADNNFRLSESMLSACSPKYDLVILCNPNNPTGQLVPPALMQKLCRLCAENGTYLLADECFLDFVPKGRQYSAREHLNPYIIVLNAFTKTFAIPGLRLGYAVFGDEEQAERVKMNGQYWSVSVPAQMAGVAALDETDYLKQAQQMIVQERAFLTDGLRDLQLTVFPSDANFILFQARDGLFRDMREELFLIRSCADFEGLDETFYRIAVFSHPENVLFLSALRRCL